MFNTSRIKVGWSTYVNDFGIAKWHSIVTARFALDIILLLNLYLDFPFLKLLTCY